MSSAGFIVAPLRFKIPDDWGSQTKFIYLYTALPRYGHFSISDLSLYSIGR